MGDELSRVKSVTAGILATVVAGAIGLSTVEPAGAAPAQAPAGWSATVDASVATAARGTSSFRVASFNVLGWSHTLNGARGRAGGVTRIAWANTLLERNRVDVAGFQELQVPQVNRFMAITAGKWALYPGLELKKRDSENSIGWRTDKFTLVDATTVKIPYFEGSPRAMPVVLLRDKSTGMLTYFSNFHNAAETSQHRNQGRWRLAASRIEIALQKQLWSTGIPRIMTGDMNERSAYFCRVTRNGTPLKAARPKSQRVNGVCRPGRPPFVDWIFGSLYLTFSGYAEDNGALAKKTSDHPVVVSTATVQRNRMPRAWASAPPHLVPRVSP